MFRECVPDRKWRQLTAALEKKTEPTDPWLAQVYRVNNGDEEDENISEALRIISKPYHRNTVMALMLSKATYAEIESSLGIGPMITENVATLLLNSEEIRHKLDHFDYVEEYVNNYVVEEGEQAFIRMGMIGGPYVLLEKLRIGHEVVQIDAAEMTKNIINTSYMLGMVARGNLITSDATKQSLQWFSRGVVNALTAVEKLELENVAEESALVAIQQRKETESLEEAGLEPTDIVH
jgi:hypothetical protein